MSSKGLFLSYSNDDRQVAQRLTQILESQDQAVWIDHRDIKAGQRWADRIESSLRGARGVIVLLSPSSVQSNWVTYEYAFARGAGVPVIAVALPKTAIPDAIQRFQVVAYNDEKSQGIRMAKAIIEGIRTQSREIGLENASEPKLIACFQEAHGDLIFRGDSRPYSIVMDLWVDGAPKATSRVDFEIPDASFPDPIWFIERSRQPKSIYREFLTVGMDSYGDIEIVAVGQGKGRGSWTTRCRLYEALNHFYAGHAKSRAIRLALEQIRKY